MLGAGVARGPGGLVGAAPPDPFPDLTRRAQEILNLLAADGSTEQIARTLGVSPKTVRNHLSSNFTKLGVTGRAAAIVTAREVGLPLSPRR